MAFFFNTNENRVYKYDYVPTGTYWKTLSDNEGTWAWNEYSNYRFPSFQEIKNQGSSRPTDETILSIAKSFKTEEINNEIKRRKNITNTFTLSTGKQIGLKANDDVIDNLIKIKSLIEDQIELGMFNKQTSTYDKFFDDLRGSNPFSITYYELLEIRLNVASMYEQIRTFEKIKFTRLALADILEEINLITMEDENFDYEYTPN